MADNMMQLQTQPIKAPWYSFFTGTPAQIARNPLFDQNQMGAMDESLQSGLGLLRQGPQFDFNPIEAKARADFAQKTVPTIAERFASGGNRSSLIDALGSGMTDLETNLAAMRANIGMQQQDMLQKRMMSLLGLGMAPRYETNMLESNPGLMHYLGKGVGQGLGMLPMFLL